MAIEVNPNPDTTPEQREVLRKVYEAQMDEYHRAYEPAFHRWERLTAELVTLRNEHAIAANDAARLEGRMDALRALAARDHITLD